jgi:hypothetical protein
MQHRYHGSSGSMYPTRISKQLNRWLFTQIIGIIGILLFRPSDNVGIVTAFEWSSAARRPEVNRQAIAGIWKLTPTLPHPLKEFTVYPKKPRIVPPELLLLLKEDGSFQQYESMSPAMTTTARIDKDEDDATTRRKSTDIDASWRQFQRSSLDNDVSQEQQRQLFPWVGYIQKGKWAYLDGNLLLAADRIDCTNSELTSKGTSYSALADGTTTHTAATRYDSASKTGTGGSVMQTFSGRPRDDTLLKGRVIANYQTRLDDNPIVSASTTSSSNTTITTTLAISQPDHGSPSSTGSTKKVKFDTYLSVPRGSIQIGKFMYPKHHPSFFEQPMFQPMKMGNFALRQILGTLNAASPSSEEDDSSTMETFQRSDFYNRTFLLTSSPLRQLSSHNDNNRGEKRWSIKYNDYVYDAPSSKKKTNVPTPDDTPTSAVRVLQIVFHRNNTFSTTGGLGNAAILRGKFDIIGNDKDHLWMQVIRFGFGRSVSGSVYSEGPMLSHEDIKAYWGKIRKVTTPVITNSTLSRDDTDNDNNNSKGLSDVHHFTDVDHRHDEDPSQHYRMEVEGSVLDGLGLEPMPVARFLLREIDSISMTDDDEEEEEEDDVIDVLEARTIDIRLDDDGVDWTSMDESFQ